MNGYTVPLLGILIAPVVADATFSICPETLDRRSRSLQLPLPRPPASSLTLIAWPKPLTFSTSNKSP